MKKYEEQAFKSCLREWKRDRVFKLLFTKELEDIMFKEYSDILENGGEVTTRGIHSIIDKNLIRYYNNSAKKES